MAAGFHAGLVRISFILKGSRTLRILCSEAPECWTLPLRAVIFILFD
jgi:hypothetical protein